MRKKISILLIILILFNLGMPLAYGQDPQVNIRNIRVKKLAQQWKGQTISFYWLDGNWVTGRLADVTTQDFVIEKNSRLTTYRHQEISAVTFPPGFLELVMTITTGLLTAGLVWGATALSAPNSNETVQGSAGALGFGTGLYFGYKSFYRKVVVELDK